MIGEDRLIRFSGCKAGDACSVVLRGASTHLLDEAERSLHDALCVLQQTMREPQTIYGGGNSEVTTTTTRRRQLVPTSSPPTPSHTLQTRMANAVDAAADTVPGKTQLAMKAFANALRQLPTIIADNAGFDSAELVSQLRSAVHSGHAAAGIDIDTGTVGDMEKLGIIESLKLKSAVLVSAAEAAEMILRVDDIIKCAPRKRQGGH